MSKWWENSDIWVVVILALAIIGPKLATTVSTLAGEMIAVFEPAAGEPVVDSTPTLSPESFPQPIQVYRQPAEVILVTPNSAPSCCPCH